MNDTRQKIVELITWGEGISDAEIARALGISRQAVHHHTRVMDLPRPKRRHKACSQCGRRIQAGNKSNLCMQDYRRSFTYVFTCTQCEKVNVLTGIDASGRRNTDKRHPDGKSRNQFCNRSCASSYQVNLTWTKRKELMKLEVEEYKREHHELMKQEMKGYKNARK